MEIYVDVLFLTNFFADFVLLSLTAEIMSVKVRRRRILFASAVGAAASVVFFAFDFDCAGIFSVLFAFAMSAAVFCPCGAWELTKCALAFFVCSAAAGGAIYADMRLFGGGMIKNGVFYASSPRLTAVFSGMYFFAKAFSAKIKGRASGRILPTVVEYNGKSVSLWGFVDTGNRLIDPISRKPVVLAEDKLLRELFGEECTAENVCDIIEKERIRIIPYKSVDAEGCFTAIVADKIYADGKCFEKPVVALCKTKLKYPVILNAGM